MRKLIIPMLTLIALGAPYAPPAVAADCVCPRGRT